MFGSLDSFFLLLSSSISIFLTAAEDLAVFLFQPPSLSSSRSVGHYSHPTHGILFSIACHLPPRFLFPKNLLDKLPFCPQAQFLLPFLSDETAFSSEVQHNGVENSETMSLLIVQLAK